MTDERVQAASDREFVLLCGTDYVERVEELIKAGADINARDEKDGVTGLMAAALGNEVLSYGTTKIAEILLQHGANVNARDNFGCTALYFAAEWGCPEIAELLIQHGADINARDYEGQTPLRLAVMNCHTETANLLRSYGAKE